MVDEVRKNIFRGIKSETGETHYFVGDYDPAIGYITPLPQKHEKVMGKYNEQKSFPTLAEAIEYKGYTDYTVAAQMALSCYKVSRIVPAGWNEALGDGYVPWQPTRRRWRSA